MTSIRDAKIQQIIQGAIESIDPADRAERDLRPGVSITVHDTYVRFWWAGKVLAEVEAEVINDDSILVADLPEPQFLELAEDMPDTIPNKWSAE